MTYVKNKEELLSHGNKKLREIALEIIEHALLKSDPYVAVKNLVKIENNKLYIGNKEFELNKGRKIYIIGAGKATFPIAKALEEILGDRITQGIITCKYGQEGKLNRCKLYHAAHPVPDEAGYKASLEMIKLAKQTEPGDIVICGITGGSSSLMIKPVKGVSVEEIREVYKLLLRSSANIIEMNAVRKHLSLIKGGRLAQKIHPKANIINLTVSDVIGDPLDYITCPTVPDTSTLEDAKKTISKYQLWDKIPQTVANFLVNSKPEDETPKELSDHNIDNYIIVPGDAACVGAEQKAQELGLNTMLLSTMFEGESKELGGNYAAIAKEILLNNRPIKPPCVVIGGGETTIKIVGKPGIGGPNQQFALGAAMWIDKIGDVVIAGVDTDGTDGVSELAGGIVDNLTIEQARNIKLDIFSHLLKFDDTPALKKLGDGILTGATGTNVNDLKVMVVFPMDFKR